MRRSAQFGAAIAISVLCVEHLAAQSLSERVAGASEPRVQFTFAARPGVCGNGRTFIQVAGNPWYGSWNDADRHEVCAEGPIRVVLDRAGRDVVSLASYAGPVPEQTTGVTDLGRVGTRVASEYLLGLAERADGRVSRDALLPAVLADSVDATARLLAIARNQNAARETRRSAISWLARPFDPGERTVKGIADVLVQIARDDNDNQSVRQSALRTLARLEHGAGTTALMELARDALHTWMAREALSALTASGDPRARQYLRDVVRRADQSDEVLVYAIRGTGGEYATSEDVKLLRDIYAKLPGERSREETLKAIGTFGGAENVRWLVALSRDSDQSSATRRRAVQYAYRGGAPIAEVIKLYDEVTDSQIKDAVMGVLVESGERQATDKLMQIARNDENTQMRRRAVSVLSRSSDERVKKFLSELVER